MTFSIDVSAIVAVLLVGIRLSVVFFATPFDAFGRVPAPIKVLWILALSYMIVLNSKSMADVSTLLALSYACLAEVLIGSVMAFGIYTMFGVFNLAGRLIDFQAGFGAANLFDPTTNEHNPLVGTLLLMLAALIFYVTDMHHLLLQGIFYSFELHPVGIGLPGLELSQIVKQFGMMFVLGVMFCGPVVGILMLIDAGVGIMSRSMPQMNVYFIFLPVKALVCMLALIMVLPLMRPVFGRILGSIFNYWQAVL